MFRFLMVTFLFLPIFSFAQMASIELEVKPVPEPTHRNSAIDAWNLSQPGFSMLTAESQEFLYWINFCRKDPTGFWEKVVVPILHTFPSMNGPEAQSLKEDLAKAGPLPMFTLNARLVQTAQSHASDISEKSATPSHTSTNGTDFGSRMKKAGIRYCANENIAVSSQSTLLAVVLLYLDIGLPEKGHRKALLNASLTETGIGSAQYGKDQVFLVQDLSCSQ